MEKRDKDSNPAEAARQDGSPVGGKPPAPRSLPPSAQAAALLRRIRPLLDGAMIRDRAPAVHHLEFLRKRSEGKAVDRSLLAELVEVEARLKASGSERARRARNVPRLSYPGELPITARKDEIVRAIRRQRIVIVSGETGCGKSTQLPKMCLEAGRGIAGRIGCTQPRRIAAVTIANRISQELGEELGRSVGYKIRFQDRTSPDAYIKVMTDGMLLAETQADRRLTEYDTLIIDEAHERSLNIDFLLGIARTLLEARSDLKLIITSATLDTEKFSAAFGGGPVVEVHGRTYPVEVEYRPPEEEDPEGWDYVDEAVRAVALLKREKPPGDILVFMPTEQDIMECVRRLEGKHYVQTSILPLFARLPSAQQGRVYTVEGPKIVVATNVAETSLTIPGIKYVVDTGLARISQYQPGSRINALPVRAVSRASADQRKGRCGRVQAGLCVRLYSEEDYLARPDFTPPEILRSDLAEVVLRMLDLRLGDPLAFPFVDRPAAKTVRDGYETLFELGAIHRQEREGWALTEAGRTMARMPLDPRISRMLLQAAREDCLREVAVLAAILSIRDPRERPPEEAAKADASQAVFRNPDSDFLTLLNIWDGFHSGLTSGVSQAERRRYCREHYLSYVRMREWGFLHDEILAVLEERRIPPGRRERREISPGLYAAIHRSILSGFLSNFAAHKEKSFYNAAKGREVLVWPGSSLFGKSPAWIVAAEVVKTTRLYARTVAKIDPLWLEDLAGELCKRSYYDPMWDRGRGEVTAKEKVTLFGLEIIRDRRVSYARINPEEAHAVFVRSALVEGGVDRPPAFLVSNLELQKRVADMEEKLRRRDIMVAEEAVAKIYSERLPGVCDLRTLEKIVRQKGDAFLALREEDLLSYRPEDKTLEGFPDRVELGGREFKAEYKFTPGSEEDGLTLKVPLGLLASIPADRLAWGVPGQIWDRVEALVRGLPKPYRKLLIPASQAAEEIAAEMDRLQEMEEGSFYKALAEFVKKRFKADIPAAEWEKADLPRHLRMRLAVTDHSGRVVEAGRDLDILKQKVGAADTAPAKTETPAWKKAREKWERTGIVAWDFGSLPEKILISTGLSAYPALEAGERGINIRLFPGREEAEASHRAGVAALLRAKLGKELDFVRRYHRIPAEHEGAALYFGGREALEKAVEKKLADEVFAMNIRTQEEYKAYELQAGRLLFDKGHALTQAALKIIESHQKLRVELGKFGKPKSAGERAQPSRAATGSEVKKSRGGPWDALSVAAESAGFRLQGYSVPPFVEEIRRDLASLVPADFLGRYSLERLVHIPRYLDTLRIRLERARIDPEKDRAKSSQVEPFARAYERLRNEISATIPGIERREGMEDRERKASALMRRGVGPRPKPPASPEKRAAVEELRWLLEEFKVCLYAPELKTACPVSAVRLSKKIREIEALTTQD